MLSYELFAHILWADDLRGVHRCAQDGGTTHCMLTAYSRSLNCYVNSDAKIASLPSRLSEVW